MTASGERLLFKRAIYISLCAHLAFLVLIIISPHLPRPSRKGLIHYIPLDMVVAGGGGGGGGGGPAAKAQAPPAKKETLRDLTTPQKAQPEAKPAMRYPVEKPKREPKAKTEKKAAITKPEPSPADKTDQAGTSDEASAGQGVGTGLRIGGGSGPGGGGFGPGGAGFGPGGGLANFPYTWYLNLITERVSSNWFSSLVDPGVSGNFQTIVNFRIEKSGQITDVKIEQSSGATPLDLSAVRAVKASAPFPPLPREYGESYLGIHLIFEHSK
ncbi:MAG TPA: cell envelope integrity protein TolA [Candidatus Desulfaltia sp.]|nr:cell envelope integrity protein TolA [Candidatus Desulfaltia sp.]